MTIKDHLVLVIDMLEYYIMKDIEKTTYGCGDTCYVALHDRLTECIKARKEIDYYPYSSVEDLLLDHGYDESFVFNFISKTQCKNRHE